MNVLHQRCKSPAAICLLFIFALLGYSNYARALERYAVIVGVSDYQSLPARGGAEPEPYDLQSPKNDVARMARLAKQLQVKDENLFILADNLDSADHYLHLNESPTKVAILSALEKVAKQTKPDDVVLFYFSGHGSQQPNNAADPSDVEPDGLDEIILPIDIGQWDGRVGSVKNAITDDEIGMSVDAIRRTGAHVWVILDSCHSGTGLRAATGEASNIEIRGVSPRSLGVPKALLESSSLLRSGNRSISSVHSGSVDISEQAWGGVTAFYAATADMLAKSTTWRIPGTSELTPNLGLLTYTITDAVLTGQVRSYRDLALRVRGAFADKRTYNVMPSFQGDFDRALFGFETVPPQQWRISKVSRSLVLEAGLLDGVLEGAIVGIVKANSNSSAPIAYAQVVESRATTSRLASVDYNGLTVADAVKIRSRSEYSGRIVAPGIPFTVRIARPADTSLAMKSGKLVAAALRQLTNTNKQLAGLQQLNWVDATDVADLYLIVGPDRVWLSDQQQSLSETDRAQPPWVPVRQSEDAGRLAARLADRLNAFARVTWIVRVVNNTGAGIEGNQLQVELFVDHVSRSEAGNIWPEEKSCPDVPKGITPNAKPVDLISGSSAASQLSHCDLVFVRVRNESPNPIDVTPLYVDRSFNIGYLQNMQRDNVRIPPGGVLTTPLQIQTYNAAAQRPYPIGVEQLLIIAVSQPSIDVPVKHYAYLANPATIGARAGSTVDNLDQLFGAAGYGFGMTGRAGALVPTEVSALRFDLRITVPLVDEN